MTHTKEIQAQLWLENLLGCGHLKTMKKMGRNSLTECKRISDNLYCNNIWISEKGWFICKPSVLWEFYLQVHQVCYFGITDDWLSLSSPVVWSVHSWDAVTLNKSPVYLHTLLISDPVYPCSLSAITLLSRASSTVTPSRHSFSSAERVSSAAHRHFWHYIISFSKSYIESERSLFHFNEFFNEISGLFVKKHIFSNFIPDIVPQ